jgi:hypothetical protein
LRKYPRVDKAIAQMTSVDKFIACLMLANRICFRGRIPRFYKNEETVRKMCPPKARQLFSLRNLRRLGVVFSVPKRANLVALDGFGIRVAKKLYETGEAKKVYELYGVQYVPL